MVKISKYIIMIIPFLGMSCSNPTYFKDIEDNLIFEFDNTMQIDLNNNRILLKIPERDVKSIDSVFSDDERRNIIDLFNKQGIYKFEGKHQFYNSQFYETHSSNLTIQHYTQGKLKSSLIVNEDFDGGLSEERSRVKKFYDEINQIFHQNAIISLSLDEVKEYYEALTELLWKEATSEQE